MEPSRCLRDIWRFFLLLKGGRHTLKVPLMEKVKPSLERSAILLAMTETREEEAKLKKSLYESFNIRCGVTELGNLLFGTGKSGMLNPKQLKML